MLVKNASQTLAHVGVSHQTRALQELVIPKDVF
jgi:hypothetical protein